MKWERKGFKNIDLRTEKGSKIKKGERRRVQE